MLFQKKLKMENILKVENGNVRLYNTDGQCLRTYYSKRDAERAYFFNKQTESVQVHLSDGVILIINKFGDVLTSIK